MPDEYGGFGGIAQYNRDLFDAISNSEWVNHIDALPRHLPQSELKPPEKLTEITMPKSSIGYLFKSIYLAYKKKPDLIICGHLHLLVVAVIIKIIFRIPVILEIYGIDAWKKFNHYWKSMLRQIDLILSISRYTRSQLINHSYLDPNKIKVLSNAIHLDQYRQIKQPNYLLKRYNLTGKLILITIGRLSSHEQYKGHDRIIKLLSKLKIEFKNLVYVIGGCGDDQTRLEKLTKEFGVEKDVIFTGKIAASEMIDHYNMAHAFAMPSTGEGFGFVFLEAAACGLPVLGGSIDGSKDALVDGKLGVMVNPKNIDQLYNGLQTILNKSKHIPSEIQRFSFQNFQTHISSILFDFFNKI